MATGTHAARWMARSAERERWGKDGKGIFVYFSMVSWSWVRKLETSMTWKNFGLADRWHGDLEHLVDASLMSSQEVAYIIDIQ